MPEAIRKPRFAWPGVTSVLAGSYTISHGISPGVAVLAVHLGSNFAKFGDLIITDDVNIIRIPNCKVDKVRKEPHGEGFALILEILDWRWRWRDTGEISGAYNQEDPHGKLRPFTIRSPEELAKLCFAKMGVTDYVIDLPPGLTKSQGENYASLNPVWLGVTPSTGTNPPVNWDVDLPAHALDALATQYGRRVVPRLRDYKMTLVIPGFGAQLPAGSIAVSSPTLDDPETPAGVTVVGDYTRYQMRLLLEAVAEEYHGAYVPLNTVSYAPVIADRQQIATVQIIQAVIVASIYMVNISFIGEDGDQQHLSFSYTVGGGDTAASVAAALTALINASTPVAAILTATSSAGTITLTGIASINFGVSASVDAATAGGIEVLVTQALELAIKPWSYSDPPQFSCILNENSPEDMVTERLTAAQAMKLAQGSVFLTYRIADIDVSAFDALYNRQGTIDAPIEVPGYGTLKRRQQVIPTDHQVEQIVPEAQDLELVDSNGLPFVVNLYNGYSRDKPAAVYGSIALALQNVFHSEAFENAELQDNTPEGEQIYVPFVVDPDNQIVRFSSHVYFYDNGILKPPPKLVLQCAVLVRNEHTNEIERYRQSKAIKEGNATAFLTRKFPDVQMNVIGIYDTATEQITEAEILEADPINRANYYLAGMEAQYFANASETRRYNGFEAIDLDGAIQQVTWEFNDNGGWTTASRNTEHDVNVPPYRRRRRDEELPPAVRDNIIEGSDPARAPNTPQQYIRIQPVGFKL